MHLLIIEDNRDFAANVCDYMTARGHVVDCASDGLGGLHLAATTDPDVIVLDLGLPGIDGLDLCRQLRAARHTTPVIMLTARSDLDDRVLGLETGADDYVVKPVALRELEARLLAQVRRAGGGLDASRLQVADLVLDENTRSVTRGGRVIPLSRLDHDLLGVLMRESPAVVSRQRLEREIWGDDPPGGDTLRAQVYRLRRAMDHGFERPLLHTVHGVGYRLADDGHAPG